MKIGLDETVAGQARMDTGALGKLIVEENVEKGGMGWSTLHPLPEKGLLQTKEPFLPLPFFLQTFWKRSVIGAATPQFS